MSSRGLRNPAKELLSGMTAQYIPGNGKMTVWMVRGNIRALTELFIQERLRRMLFGTGLALSRTILGNMK